MMFMPKIVGFICNWSVSTEAITKTNTMRGHPKIRIARVMCVGSIDPAFVLETFMEGVDGVLVIGCHPPDCHYIEGNLHVERKIGVLRKLISRAGLESERLRLGWGYPFEIERLARLVEDFRNQIMPLGPSRLAGERPDIDMLLNMRAAVAVAKSFRFRLLVGRERSLTEKENSYGERMAQAEFDQVMNGTIEAEYLRSKMYLMLRNGPLSVVDMSKYLDVSSKEALRHLVVLKERGLLALQNIEGQDPVYIALEAG